jgi:hypothetical protein
MAANPQPESKATSRRALLAGALGGLGAWAASAIGRTSQARAANGDPVIVGVTTNTGTSVTKITNTDPGETAIWGLASNATGIGVGVRGEATAPGYGVYGTCATGWGVFGNSTSNYGVHGHSTSSHGVHGQSNSGVGVYASSSSNIGVYGTSTSDVGVYGSSTATDQPAAFGWSYGTGTGVQGYSGTNPPAAPSKTGVFGYAAQDANAVGVRGESTNGFGVYGKTTGTGFAGYFNGKTFMSQFVEIAEMTTPAAPGGARARLFVRDNAGKTQLCVRFPTGAVKVLATES